jgi:4-amino-4-deoxy-L-arabinose transferase-like glycosyltransferase
MAPEAPARPRSTLLSILALWVIFYASFTLFTPPLLDDADSVHAEVAREMLLRHDYVTLYANGIRYLEKAPLLYWSMAASFRLFGVSTAAARVPLALTVLALALAVETFARRAFHSTQAGLYAALILLSSFGIFIFTRIIIPDAMVCLWLTLALYCFWLTEENSDSGAAPSRRLCWAFAACCALNVLTKGLIGIVFPIAIVAIYLLLTRGWSATIARIRQLYPLSSTAVFLAIAAPWHILIALANPTQGHPGGLTFAHGHFSVPLPTQGNVHGWLWFYFVNEQVLRYLNIRVPRDYDTVPLWLFWGLCLIWLMPWSAFMFKAVGQLSFLVNTLFRAIEHGRWRHKGYLNQLRAMIFRPNAERLLILWMALPLLFFSLSTRQEYYVLPAFPAIAVLIAGWLARDGRIAWQPVTRQAREIRRTNLRITAFLLALGSLFATFSFFLLLHTRALSPSTDLAQLLQQHPSNYALSMGHFLDLNAQALSVFRLPLALAASGLFFGPLVSFVLRKRARHHAATLVLATGAFGFLIAADLGLKTFAPVLTSAQLAKAIAPQVHPEDLIVIHQEYEYGSTLGFYLRRPGPAGGPIHILEGRSSNLWYGGFFPDAPDIFETPKTIAQRWSRPQRIFLWQDLANQLSPLTSLPGPVYVIARSGGKEIVSNQPNR